MEFVKLVLSSGMYIKERNRQRQREFGSKGKNRTIFSLQEKYEVFPGNETIGTW